jgi:hypothetical protein
MKNLLVALEGKIPFEILRYGWITDHKIRWTRMDICRPGKQLVTESGECVE